MLWEGISRKIYSSIIPVVYSDLPFCAALLISEYIIGVNILTVGIKGFYSTWEFGYRMNFKGDN